MKPLVMVALALAQLAPKLGRDSAAGDMMEPELASVAVVVDQVGRSAVT